MPGAARVHTMRPASVRFSRSGGTMDNLAIYSIFCGPSSAKTANPTPVDPRYPHFFISNNYEILEETAAAGWTPVFIDLAISDDPVASATQAKIPKAAPWAIGELMGFDYLCYKDDKWLVHMDGLDENIAFMKNANAVIGIRSHPFLGDNILFEFGESMHQPRYKSQWERMVNYITEEVANGYQLKSRIFATGSLLRNMKHPDTEAIGKTWLEHIGRCGIECQISFDFVAQRFSSIVALPIKLLI
ncbi:hypothetical protein AiwAL_00775 [Acidiphilium sp. AL]|uniref:hypothetical protein n=1 Tax=Acidiphilium sp. AL TaxID=2871704 RepID=UPI0021CB9007|nr:hypothetical protein [Acidiphilium sp. AL]MCU4158641.1 hypothetical protein [Acidiphilium sp. AL]